MSYKCWPNIWVYLLDKIKVEVGLLPSKKLFYLLQWKPSKDDEKWNWLVITILRETFLSEIMQKIRQGDLSRPLFVFYKSFIWVKSKRSAA